MNLYGVCLNAQEHLYQTPQPYNNHNSVHTSTWLQGDSVGLSWGLDSFYIADGFTRNKRMYEAYFDQDGFLLDTIRHDNLQGPGTWTGLRGYWKTEDGKVYKAYAGVDTDSLAPLSFVRVSQGGQTLYDIPMPKDSGQWIVPSMIYVQGDTLMVGGQVAQRVGISGTLYLGFWRDSVKLKEMEVDSNGHFALPISARYYNNNWLIGIGSGWSKMLRINKNLQLVNKYLGISGNPDAKLFIDFIPSSKDRSIYAPFFKDRDSWGIARLNSEFNEVKDTSFRLLSARGLSHSYFKTATYYRSSSYLSADSIFMLSCRKTRFYIGEYHPDSVIPLDVMCIDTSGAVHWERTVGFGENYIYNPFTIQATTDGGALLFASKYDPTDPDFGPQPHTKLAVIKIGGDGAVLHQREYPMPGAASLALFPNPTSDYLHFPRQGEAEIAPQVFVYSAAGESVALKAEPEARGGFWQMSVAELAPGSYWLSLRNEAGGVQTGYFVKQ